MNRQCIEIFLGVYGGNQSALALMAELSERVPADLDVKFEEVNIDRRLIRIKVSANSFKAADRLVTALAESESFRNAKVSSEVKKGPRGVGVRFDVGIKLTTPGGDLE